MTTLYDIRERAEALARKTAEGSITPEELGGLIADLTAYTQTMERDGSTLGIRKVYPTLEAMQADTNPVGEGDKPLRRGNLVAIYDEATATTDTSSGLVSMYTGSGFVPVARIGTALRHENTALERRIGEIEQGIRHELRPTDEALRIALESLTKDVRRALDRLEYTKAEQDKLAKIKTDGKAQSYLGADGQYHSLPVRNIKVNGKSLVADSEGEVAITTPQGTVQSLIVGGTTLNPNQEGEIELGLHLKTELTQEKQTRLVLEGDGGERIASVDLPQCRAGGGSGFLNITQEVPLSTGYYTLPTALKALKTLTVEPKARRGLIITIETAESKWQDYRYQGVSTSDDAFYSEALWTEYVTSISDEHIKTIARSVTLDIEVAQSLDETYRPVASAVVKQAVEAIGALTLDADTEPTSEGTQVTLSQNGRQVTQFTVVGGGSGGNGQTTRAAVTARLNAGRIKLGDKASLDYGFTHYVDGEADGTVATLSLEVRRGTTLITHEALGQFASGTSGTLDLSKYLTSADSYSITVIAEYEYGGERKTRRSTTLLSVISLSIELYNEREIESYLASGGYKASDPANIIITVRGAARELTMIIDGDWASREARQLSGSGGRQTFSLSPRQLAPGSHRVEFFARIDGINSNSLYMDILIAGSDEPFVGLLYSRADGLLLSKGEIPRLLAHQYEGFSYRYIAVGTEAGGTSRLTLQSPSGEQRNFLAPRRYQSHSLRPMERGTSEWHYELGRTRKAFKVEVIPSALKGIGIKEGTRLELLAIGRSNAEGNPSQWQSGNVATRFHGVDWASSGWTGDALRLINGAKAIIDYKPFATDAKATGLTITMEVKATDVRSAVGSIIHCYDEASASEGGFGGLIITPSTVKMPTGGRVEFRSEEGETIVRQLGLDAPFASGDYYHIALVVHPASEQKNVRLYINGVISKADTYQDTVFGQRSPQGITLDSTHANIELRHIRVWETALTDDEILQNYITDRPTLTEMEALRKRNDVLDEGTGNISWDKLHERGKGSLNITMEDGGGIERLWGKSTDTKTNYRVAELLYRSPYGRAYDLKVTNAVVRRQGTSTSTYPVKNLRIYLSRVPETKVYRNTGTGQSDIWEEVPERTYTMRQGAKPMSIINLKADYADSSMMNNTEGAKLWDGLLRSVPSLQTAGMKNDPEARAAIDGIAISLFTSDTPSGQRRYAGQFQFNNDKSKSGYLFGQTKTDGTEIALEGINNTNAVANFRISGDVATQLARTDADGFDASFELLYPEKDYTWATAPESIKQAVVRLFSFIKACQPAGQDLSRMTEAQVKEAFRSQKFKSEVAQYFNVDNLCAWWVWTDYMMAVDQRAKNTFLRTWDGLVWAFTYYDGDTSWRLRNDAFLAYDYNANRDTWDAQRSKYAFEGRSSILWALVIANLWDDIKRVAAQMRRVLTDDVVRRAINSPHNHYSEREYNKSLIYKYIKPTYIDYNGGGTMNYIFALNGTMQASKEDIIHRRFSLLDAGYNPDDMLRRDNIPCYVGKGTIPTTMTIHAGDEYYFGWGTQNGSLRQYERVERDKSLTLHFPDAISQNDPVRIAGASRIVRLDLQSTAPYMQGAMNLNGCTILTDLIAPIASGRGSQWYPLLGKISGLKRIDLSGQNGITGTEDEQARTFDVSSHLGLEELKLGGTSVRAVRVAPGSPLVRLELPASLSYLRLRALPNLTMEGIQVADWTSVKNLELAGCPHLDWRQLLERCTSLERLRVEGVDFEDDGTLLSRLTGINGLDTSGAGTDTCQLIGKCQLTKYIDDQLLAQYQRHFPELHIRQPHYTMIEFDEQVSIHANISNPDNGTGYRFGKPYEPSGHIKAILMARHGYLVKRTDGGKLSICQLHDSDWRFYADHTNTTLATPAMVDGSEGELFILEPRYWYKGINDIRGQKNYACYAFGTRPEDPKGVKLTVNGVKRGERGSQWIDGYGFSVGSTLSEAMRKAEGYAVCIVDVSGYKRVSFQSTVEYGGAFLDASGHIVKNVSALDNNRTTFNDGMTWLEDVPENATKLYFTILKEMGNDFACWLTNSLRIEDTEPEWIEHEPVLVSAVRMSLDGGRVRSVVKVPGESEPWTNQTLEQFQVAFKASKVDMLDYETRKDITNLFFAKYGTRSSNEVFGDAPDYYNAVRGKSKLGAFVETGMSDTRFDQGRYYRTIAAAGTPIEQEHVAHLAKEMGYEAFSFPSAEFVSGIGYVSAYHNVRKILNLSGRHIAMYNGGYHQHTHGSPVARVVHGKRMDIVALSSEDPKRGDSLGYGNHQRFDIASPDMVVSVGYDHAVSGRNGLLCMWNGYRDLKGTWLSCRGMLRGDILEVKDPNVYKALKEI